MDPNYDHRSMQMMRVYDNQYLICGEPMPALTSLLYQICEGDHKKFDEACRLISLFMDQAEKEAPR